MIWIIVGCLHWAAQGATGQCVFPGKGACITRTLEIKAALKLPPSSPVPFCLGKRAGVQLTREEVGDLMPRDRHAAK